MVFDFGDQVIKAIVVPLCFLGENQLSRHEGTQAALGEAQIARN